MEASLQRERKRVSLKEMLRWAYNRQQVDVLTGRTLDDAAEWRSFAAGFSEDSALRAMRRRELGTMIDCAGSNRFAAADVHPDAEALHGAVLELGPIDARLLIVFGHTGTFPEPVVAIARPLMFERAVETGTRGGRPPARRKDEGIESWEWQEGEGKPAPPDRCEQGNWQGEATLYVIRVAETIIEDVPVYRLAGRRKTTISHYERKRFDIEYCPIEYWPDLTWVQAVNGVAEHWDGAIAKLKAKLAAVAFSEHEIVDLEEAGELREPRKA